jgi:hypothetical protein
MTADNPFEAPTWSKVHRLLQQQAERIRKSGFKPEVIVGIARGGWIPARVLSDLLETPNLVTLKVESYLDINTRGKPVLTQGLSGNVNGKNVLLVDEVADTGESLNLAKKHILHEGASEIQVATLYLKPQCAFKPDYYERNSNAWIVFPWETQETLRKIWVANSSSDSQLKAQLSLLIDAGLPKLLIAQFMKEISEA